VAEQNISTSNVIVRFETNLAELQSSANQTAAAVLKLEATLDGSKEAADNAGKSINGLRALQNKYTADLYKLEIGSEEYLRVQKELVGVNQKLNREMGILDGTVKKQTTSVVGLKGILAGVAAGFAGIQLGAFVQQIAGLGIKAEQTKISFETFLGSADKAKQVLGELNEFAAVTPFETEQVEEAGKALLAFGVPARKLIPTLKAVGDISAGTGKDFNELAVIFGKAKTQGVLFAEDINQLTESGIPVIQEFAKQLGVSEGEVKKLASEGKISFANLEKAFQSLTGEGGKFFDLTARQSQSVGGLLSTLQSNIVDLGKKVGVALLPVFKAVVNAAISFVAGISDIGGIIQRNIPIIIAVATALLTFNAATIQAALNTARLAIATRLQTLSFSAQVVAMKAAQAIGAAYSVVVGVLTGRITLATVAQRAWNLVMSLNPIGLLVTAVGALSAALVYYNRNNAQAIELDKAKVELSGKIKTANNEITASQDEINKAIDSYNEKSPKEQANLKETIRLRREEAELKIRALERERDGVENQARQVTTLQNIKNSIISALNPFPDVTKDALNTADAFKNAAKAVAPLNEELDVVRATVSEFATAAQEIETIEERNRQERLRKAKEAYEAGRKDREKALEQQKKDEADAAKAITDLRIAAIEDETERKIAEILIGAKREIDEAKGTESQIAEQRLLINQAMAKEIDKIRTEANAKKAIEVKIQTVEEKRFNIKSSLRDNLITEDDARIEEQKLVLETLKIQLENAGDDRIKIMQQIVDAEIALEQLLVDEKKKIAQKSADERIKDIEERRLAVKESLRDGLIDAEDAALAEQKLNIEGLKVELDLAVVDSIDYIKIKQQIADVETAIEKEQTAKTKAELEERRKLIVESAQAVIGIAKSIADARIAQLDREIAAQQGRVDAALQTIDQGNTEQVQMEQDRLNKLNEARENAVEKQRVINAIEIAANNALAISQAILGATAAFKEGNLVKGIATSIALAATVASTVLSVKGALSGIGSFAKGKEKLTMKDGRPTKGTGILIEAHAGERILTAKQNKEIGSVSNEKAVDLIKKGREAGSPIKPEKQLTQNKKTDGLSNDEAVELVKKVRQLTTYENMRTIVNNTRIQSDSLSEIAGASVQRMQVDIDGLRSEMKTVNAQLQTTNKKLSNIQNEVYVDERGVYSISQKFQAREQQKKRAIR
jgi:tape measure domain-containing protein